MLLLTFNPGLELSSFRTTWARFQNIKKYTRITATLYSYYYENNNDNKCQQGSMNISTDITIKTNIKQNY